MSPIPLYPTYVPHKRPNFPPTYQPAQSPPEWKVDKRHRVINELKAVGVSNYGLLRSELRQLASILHQDELVKGVVYGYGDDGFALLVATDRRVLYIDKKPLFMKTDEVTYDLVGGISYAKVGLLETVTLHTRVSDYKLRTFNYKSAQYFIDFIEHRCLEHKLRRAADGYDDYINQDWPLAEH